MTKLPLLRNIIQKKHIESFHEGKKTFRCNLCDLRFTQNGGLKSHIQSVHEVKRKHDSKKRHDSKRHIESVHEGITRYACEICGKGFYDKRDLEKHITCVHDGMKPFECPNCEKCFALKVL